MGNLMDASTNPSGEVSKPPAIFPIITYSCKCTTVVGRHGSANNWRKNPCCLAQYFKVAFRQSDTVLSATNRSVIALLGASSLQGASKGASRFHPW